MKKKPSHQQELAALHALGAIDGEDAREFSAQLAADASMGAETLRFARVTEALGRLLPSSTPPAHLKERILQQAAASRARQQAAAAVRNLVPPSQGGGLSFLRDAGADNWLPLPVAGAFVKLLSFDQATEYAVVLGKLAAGSRYPSHQHLRSEDIFMISGDLHIGEEVIRAGDFHHADAGSTHGVNWSEAGCVLLCVLSKEDLLAQLVPTQGSHH